MLNCLFLTSFVLTLGFINFFGPRILFDDEISIFNQIPFVTDGRPKNRKEKEFIKKESKENVLKKIVQRDENKEKEIKPDGLTTISDCEVRDHFGQ